MSKRSGSSITLRGSAAIVAEYFGYALNTILYQRGIYDPDDFTTVKKYGLKLYVTTNEKLSSYFKSILRQLTEWLTEGEVRKLVLVLMSVDSKEVIERWVFNIETDKNAVADKSITSDKDVKEIQGEIAAIMRQITASVTFLPSIDDPAIFDLLIYTNQDSDIPSDWELSDPKFITNSNEVRLKSFSTKLHKVDTSVTFRVEE